METAYANMLSPPYTPPHSPTEQQQTLTCCKSPIRHTDLDAVETLLSISRASVDLPRKQQQRRPLPPPPPPPLSQSVQLCRQSTPPPTSESETEDCSAPPCKKRPRHDSELARLLMSDDSPPRTPSPTVTSMPVSVIVRASSFSFGFPVASKSQQQQRTYTPPPPQQQQPTSADITSKVTGSSVEQQPRQFASTATVPSNAAPVAVVTRSGSEESSGCLRIPPVPVVVPPPQPASYEQTKPLSVAAAIMPKVAPPTQLIPLVPLTMATPRPHLNEAKCAIAAASPVTPQTTTTVFMTPVQTQTLFPIGGLGHSPIMHFVLATAPPSSSVCGLDKDTTPRFRPLFPAPLVLPTCPPPSSSSQQIQSSEAKGGAADTRRRLYQCEYKNCDKKYFKSSHLKAHIRTHTGEKPFVCTWDNCGRCFSRSDELSRHKRTHTGEKKFVCPTCSHRFMRSDHLTKHIKRHMTSKKTFSWQTETSKLTTTTGATAASASVQTVPALAPSQVSVAGSPPQQQQFGFILPKM